MPRKSCLDDSRIASDDMMVWRGSEAACLGLFDAASWRTAGPGIPICRADHAALDLRRGFSATVWPVCHHFTSVYGIAATL